MKKHERVKTAVIGCGTISHIYMSNIKKRFRILELVGCSDIIPERARKRAEEFGCRAMTNEEILNDPSIELVINLTYPEAHYEVSKAIILAGKHCYCEKMMCADYVEALELHALADEKGVLYATAPDTFLGGGWQSARKYIDDGLIGSPVSVFAVVTCSYQPNSDMFDEDPDHFFFPLHPGGGLPYDLGGYYIHNMLNILGPVKRVAGFGGNIDPHRIFSNPHHPRYGQPFEVNTFTTLAAALEFENGTYGTIITSSDSSNRHCFSIQGTEATLDLFNPDYYSGRLILRRPGALCSGEDKEGLSADDSYRPEPDLVRLPVLHGFCDNSRGLGAADLGYALRNGRRPRVHNDIGLHAIELIHGMIVSGRSGQIYEMTSSFERPKPLMTTAVSGNGQEVVLDD